MPPCAPSPSLLSCLFLGLLSATLSSGCGLFKDCKRDGCEAVVSRVPDDGSTGIAGKIAAPSDVVENGCQQCPFASTSLQLTKVSFPVTDALSAKVAIASSTSQIVDANEKYFQEAEPGNYVLCQGTSCIAIEVVQHHWTTVHLLLGNRAPTFLVFDAVSGQRIGPPTFEITP